MGRSAKQLDIADLEASPVRDAAAAVSGMIARNPVLVGGTTAFLVALSFVSANALWYQPHAHSGAFFATRDFSGHFQRPTDPTETTILIERPEPRPQPKGDPKIEQVQSILRDLNFYAGTVDGIPGPNTRKAIESYQAKMGLAVTGTVDDLLLDQLGAVSTTAGIIPTPAPRDELAERIDAKFPKPAMASADERIIRIQAGLKAFGNEDIQMDGVLGARTKSAILEFQSLFGLPETGEPNEQVYAKMKEIGLTN